MAIDKLIPQYLTSDTDQKLVKSVEMVDNLNVRVSNDAEGTSGVIKNVKGTEVVGAKTAQDEFPTGENRVIGSVASEKSKEVIFFLWNSNQNHGIYRINTSTGNYTKVYEDSVLGFQKLSHLDSDIIINEDSDTIVYWTDNVNPPMKLNVNRLATGGYPYAISSGTDEEKLLCLTVAKQPPLKAPAYVVRNNPAVIGESRIKSNNYQFAYRYVYTDGEHSALSPYSSLSFANAQIVDGFNTNEQKNFFNQIDVSVQNSPADVDKIIVYAKRVNGRFFEIAELENQNNSNFVNVAFTDNVLGKYLSESEVNKIYDNVPQLAKAQAVAGNRLMYGNYTEGYDNIDTSVELIPNYHKNPDVFDIDITIDDRLLSGGRDFTIDYTNLPAIITDQSKLMVNFFIDFETVQIAGLGSQNIDLDYLNNELFINYAHRETNEDFSFKYLSIETIKGSGLLSNILSQFLVDMGLASGFDPAITMSAEGVQVKEILDVPAGSTKAQVKDIVKNRLESKEFTMFLNPTRDERRFSRLTPGTSTLFNVESASFKGKMNCTIEKNVFFNDPNIDEYRLSGKTAELQIYEFTDGSGREAVIKSTNKFKLDLNNEMFLFTTATLLEGASGLYTNLVGDRSFKSGSSHQLGIVYYDDRGRASGVNELGDIFVNHLNDRADENDLDGKTSIVMRIDHTAPSWAKRWSPVYTGKGNVDLKFQYGVKGAYTPTNNIERSTVFSSEENIYVSINSLFNKENSYTKSSNALIDYNFEAGDKIRIIKYGNNERTKYEFDIVDYKTLTSDEESNPILEKISENALDATTGDFLVIKDNPAAVGFNYSSIVKNQSKWFENCIIEVYRDVKERTEDVYYEVGKSYLVQNGVHEDDRTATSFTGSLITSAGEKIVSLANTQVFKGDTLLVDGKTIEVGNVWKEGSLYSFYVTDRNPVQVTDGSYIFTVQNTDSVINLSLGDVYFRVRGCVVSTDQINSLTYTNVSSQNTQIEFIEDYSVSDFFKSKASSIGRPFAYIPEAKTIRRRASVTYSEAYIADSDIFGLSSFNLSLANWTDLELASGSIQSMINRSEALTVIQENKACQVPINRNLIEYADGNKTLTASKNVLSTPSYYAGDFGTSNPESVIERFGVVYYADIDSRRIIRLSSDGITPISEKGMSSFFQILLEDLGKNVTVPKIVGGFDPDNDEYLLTVEDFSQSTISVYNADPQLEPTVYEVEINDDGLYEVEPIYTSSTILWNSIEFDWNDICAEWDEVGNGILYLDSSTLYIDNAFIGSTGSTNILVTDSNFSFVATAVFNLGSDIVDIATSTCGGQLISTNFGGAESSGVTIAYKHKEGVWSSKYSFLPSNYSFIGNTMYSFFQNDNGLAWEHNVNELRNNFYGVQYVSSFESVSNYNPSMIKVYQSLAVEGSGTWTAELFNEKQETEVSYFEDREGHQYSMIPRDILNSTSHKVYLGTVTAVNANKITFGSPVNRLPFVVGDLLKTASGSSLNTTGLTIQSIENRNTIVCSGAGISVGQDVFVEHSSIVDGDPMRDVYLKVKMTSEDTTPFEVHALSLHYDRSRLHNERVN